MNYNNTKINTINTINTNKLLINLDFGYLNDNDRNNNNLDKTKLLIRKYQKLIVNSFKKLNNWSEQIQYLLDNNNKLKKNKSLRMTHFNNDY